MSGELSQIPPEYRVWALRMMVDGYKLEEILWALYKAEGAVVDEFIAKENAAPVLNRVESSDAVQSAEASPLKKVASDGNVSGKSGASSSSILDVFSSIRMPSLSLTSSINSVPEVPIYNVGDMVELQRNNGHWTKGVVVKVSADTVKVDYFRDGTKWCKMLPPSSTGLRHIKS
jgi:hypothetical protein